MEIDGYMEDRVKGVEARVLLYIDGVTDHEKYNHFISTGTQFSEVVYMGQFSSAVPKQVAKESSGAVELALKCIEDGPETALLLSDVKDRSVQGSVLLISKHPQSEIYKITYMFNLASGLQPVGHIAYVGKPEELAKLLDA